MFEFFVSVGIFGLECFFFGVFSDYFIMQFGEVRNSIMVIEYVYVLRYENYFKIKSSLFCLINGS